MNYLNDLNDLNILKIANRLKCIFEIDFDLSQEATIDAINDSLSQIPKKFNHTLIVGTESLSKLDAHQNNTYLVYDAQEKAHVIEKAELEQNKNNYNTHCIYPLTPYLDMAWYINKGFGVYLKIIPSDDEAYRRIMKECL